MPTVIISSLCEIPQFPSLTLTFFPTPISGPHVKAEEWKRITTPQKIPVYSIVNREYLYKTSEDNQFLIPLFVQLPQDLTSPDDAYYTTTAADERRLDMISYKMYGTVEYVWIIILANNITDPFTIPLHTRLRIPSLANILTKWISPALGGVF